MLLQVPPPDEALAVQLLAVSRAVVHAQGALAGEAQMAESTCEPGVERWMVARVRRIVMSLGENIA